MNTKLSQSITDDIIKYLQSKEIKEPFMQVAFNDFIRAAVINYINDIAVERLLSNNVR
jgi:hypothetical protein